MKTSEQVAACRAQFPALSREINGQPAVFFDGPAGTQVPRRVIDAVSDYFCRLNANHGGLFATSRASDSLLDETHRAIADFVGASDPDEISFGPNMTTLTFALSRSLAKTWGPGDEIVVTKLDHDANFSPWVLAARDAGATVRIVEFRRDDCTLDLDDLRSKLSRRTKLVAVGCASNATGTINPVRDIVKWAHEVGALTFLDAVHYAPHGLVDVRDWNCDFLACSAYKFFGPHTGVLWGRRELLESLTAYKVRPAPDSLPGKWMTGTQNHECLAGTLAAVDYLTDLGRQLPHSLAHSQAARPPLDRRAALTAAFRAIGNYERDLAAHFLRGLAELPAYNLWGLSALERLDERCPTFAITHTRRTTTELATALAARGIFVWHGNYYALNLTEALGLEPEGMVRIGFVHYNTADEVDRLVTALADER